MIWHEAIGINIAKFQPFISYFVQEVFVILSIKEYSCFVIAAVKNVVDMVWIKVHFLRIGQAA